MLADQWDYPLTTDAAAAVDALNRSFASYVGFRVDLMAQVEAAIAADPEFALAHAARGILITTLRKPELYAAARDELALARNGRHPQTRREQLYLDALDAACKADITAAVACFEQILCAHPLDLFALRLCQSELFWIGEVDWMRDVSERAAPSWDETRALYPGFLAIRAFGLEECGDYERAESYGREAVERDPAEYWGTHAVAHVLLMQGRLGDGIEWLAGLQDNWSQANHILHHLWWHQALFHIENRDFDAALEIFDRRLRDLESPLMRAIPDFFIDIQNDVALLQRLEMRAIDVGERWQPIAELAFTRSDNHSSPFTSAHCVLALAAAGRFEDAARMVANMRAFIAADDNALGPRYGLAVLPASIASIAFCQGDYQRVVDILMPARRNLWQMGGSHAQRDLFYQLLVNAAHRLERGDLLTLLRGDLQAIGFERLAERSSYADSVALAL